MTLPTAYSWSPVGQPVCVPYEANQGRRLNLLGAYFSAGVEAGRFAYELYLGLPKSRAKKTKGQILRLPAGVSLEEVGAIDGPRLVAFLWKLSGRPPIYPAGWKRVRPLYVWMNNYSVDVGQAVKEALPALEAADVHLCYLPAYCPELSEMEPIWQDVKYRQMTKRSFDDILALRRAAQEALDQKAAKLLLARQETTNLLRLAA